MDFKSFLFVAGTEDGLHVCLPDDIWGYHVGHQIYKRVDLEGPGYKRSVMVLSELEGELNRLLVEGYSSRVANSTKMRG